ncbi:MAG: efflux RND transporter periplasmic adaptor subunit [Candidatus Binataceae bacterium]
MMRTEPKLGRAMLAIAAAAAILLCGCRKGGGGESEEAPAPTPVLVVSAARARIEPMTGEIRLFGRTIARRQVIVRAPAAGRVEGMRLEPGEAVRKGRVVAHIISREIEAAEAGLAVAKRIEPKQVPALAAAIRRNRLGAGIAVVAPDSGVVAQPPAVNGQLVAALDPLVSLIDPASLYVEAEVPIGEVHLLQPGMTAAVTTPLRPGAEFPGRVTAVLPAFNSASASSTVRVDFTGAERIAQSGAPVEVRAEIARIPDAISIPAAALFQDPGVNRFHVFTIGPGAIARRTPVTLGIRESDRVQVTAGLKAGDLVITSGGYALSGGLKVRAAASNRDAR